MSLRGRSELRDQPSGLGRSGVVAVEERVRSLVGDEFTEQCHRKLSVENADDAVGLPAAAYTSDAWLALENERIFQRSWVFAGAVAQLERPGAMLPVEIGGCPIVLVRGTGGEIRGFHNVCRHRGAALVDAPCARSTITCPYHRWTYRLDGGLALRPHFHGPDKHDRPDADLSADLGLLPVRTAVWHGCVFANISGGAPVLDQWLAPLQGRIGSRPLRDMRWVDCIRFEIDANWKFALENYMEGYHVFALHPRLLEHAPMNVRWSGEWTGGLFYNDYVAPSLTASRGSGLPHWADLDETEQKRGSWTVTFPQFAAEMFADQFVVLSVRPVAPGKTIEELHIFVVGDAAANADEYRAARDDLVEMWRDLNREDIDALERLQLGRRSPAYDGGRFSPAWEGPTHDFGGMVVAAILADESDFGFTP